MLQQKTLLSAAMLAPLLFGSLVFIFRIFGYTLHFRHLHVFDLSVEGISLVSPTYTLAIGKLSLRFHLPTSRKPSWAVIVAEECDFKDADCAVTFLRGASTLWFFPVFFRQTSGPWITTSLDGFSVIVFTSENTPRWVQLLRNNMIYTILDGETIRLNNLKSRIQFSTLTGSKEGYNGQVEKPGLRPDEQHDEIKLHLEVSQWHIVNVRRRMYTYGDVKALLRRNWAEDHGSLIVCSEGSKWTKMPALAQQEAYRKSSTFGQLFHSLYSFPSELFKIFRDPLTTVDLDVLGCDITFLYFRIRDAEILKQGAMKVRRDYQKFDDSHPGVLMTLTWDMLMYGICAVLNHGKKDEVHTENDNDGDDE
ncbi:hypothetical protein CPB83DRAFT_842202 [Crepidotus variabilis]|uniref:Uncharacterized protein n=1 Tax=Crepidotus variabilis TaxID=179855 RepID=A0A9P6EUF2_9AGAR|nr:hypothetical protein CPB83DRAFT_842202 [Crepidotus variabilis]